MFIVVSGYLLNIKKAKYQEQKVDSLCKTSISLDTFVQGPLLTYLLTRDFSLLK